jgi:Mg2+ and Co2+ transporter CorA
MNTKGLPFAEDDHGSLYATLLCFAASALVYMLMRALKMVK